MAHLHFLRLYLQPFKTVEQADTLKANDFRHQHHDKPRNKQKHKNNV